MGQKGDIAYVVSRRLVRKSDGPEEIPLSDASPWLKSHFVVVPVGLDSL